MSCFATQKDFERYKLPTIRWIMILSSRYKQMKIVHLLHKKISNGTNDLLYLLYTTHFIMHAFAYLLWLFLDVYQIEF